MLNELQKKYHLSEGVSVRDLISFPDVMTKGGVTPAFTDIQNAELKTILEKEVNLAIDELLKMRAQEGEKLTQALLLIVQQFKQAHHRFLGMRTQIQKRAQEKIKKRIEQCFESYTTPDAQMRALMETRIAQEISYTMDKLDIEEELTRFAGHIDQIEKLLTVSVKASESPGKKLDFLFQELNREINTLGNKAQDLEISQEVIQLKMWVEQMREQSLNLE